MSDSQTTAGSRKARAQGDPEGQAAALRRALRRLGPADTIGRVRLVEEHGGGWAQARDKDCERFNTLGAGVHGRLYCGKCAGDGCWAPIPREEFINLLAYCGDLSAREALGEVCSCGVAPVDDGPLTCLDENMAPWLEYLARWCPTLPAVAAICAARWVLHKGNWLTLTARFGHDGLMLADVAMRAAEAWRDGGRTRALAEEWGHAVHNTPGFVPSPFALLHPEQYPPESSLIYDTPIWECERLRPGAQAEARRGLLEWLLRSIR